MPSSRPANAANGTFINGSSSTVRKRGGEVGSEPGWGSTFLMTTLHQLNQIMLFAITIRYNTNRYLYFDLLRMHHCIQYISLHTAIIRLSLQVFIVFIFLHLYSEKARNRCPACTENEHNTVAPLHRGEICSMPVASAPDESAQDTAASTTRNLGCDTLAIPGRPSLD